MTCRVSTVGFCLALAVAFGLRADELPRVDKVERQPLAAQAKRVADALAHLGSPLPPSDRDALQAALDEKDDSKAIAGIQAVLDRHCLAGIRVADKGKPLAVVAGPAKPVLAEQGWRLFLVKIDNVAGVKDVELRIDSPNALPISKRSTGKPDPTVIPVGEVSRRFLDLATYDAQPLVRDLSGLEVEYRIVQLYSRDPGRKEGALQFSLWGDAGDTSKPRVHRQGSNELTMLFDVRPAVVVKLGVKDHDGQPVTASFTFKDKHGRVYPSLSRRLAPDFGFHPQIYRKDGETVLLQPGRYTVTWTRGPEYEVGEREITIPEASTHSEAFELKRWIHLAKKGWWSGDHHIHAAGCKHYESPTEGVTPEDMMRHVLGEDLNVGCCLSWGPCWYHQKRYFDGKPHPLSTPTHVLRYDVEVSGFPSSHCGHICLLRLREQDYPGTKLINDWPSWDLPIFKWAKGQGAVVGFAHSGFGLAPENPNDPEAQKLPNYLVPRMDGIGANEYLVDVAHGACDFISTVNTPSVWELNAWYHTLNCGYRCRISGETDFPCIFGERVGIGRSYVKLEGKLDFDQWAEGIKNGRCYVCDGKSHLVDFQVGDVAVGTKGSELRLEKPGKVKVAARVAALLEPKPTPRTEELRSRPLTRGPYWDLERARIKDTRTVPVEVVVNGQAVASKPLVADGTERDMSFDIELNRSSWVCLRIFPSSHTNPVFVVVDGKPIRVSKKSAEWCLKGIDECWKRKSPAIRKGDELKDAEAAYETARKAYRKIAEECPE